MRKIKGGDFAGIHFGPIPGTSLFTGIAHGLTNVSRTVAAMNAKHPEMAKLKRFATAFNNDYESRMKSFYSSRTHDFWWAEKRLFESYYSESLREEHAHEEKMKREKRAWAEIPGMTKPYEGEDSCKVKKETYPTLLEQENDEFKDLGEEVKAASDNTTYSIYYLYFSKSILRIIQELTDSDSEEAVVEKYKLIRENMKALAEAINLVLDSEGMKAIGIHSQSDCRLEWQIYAGSTWHHHERDADTKKKFNDYGLYEIREYINKIKEVADRGIKRLTKKMDRKSQGRPLTKKEDEEDLKQAQKQAETDEIDFKKKLTAAKQAKEETRGLTDTRPEGTSGSTDTGQEGAPGSTEQRQEGAPESTDQRQERAPGSTAETIGGKYLDGIMRKKHTKKRQIRRKRMRPSRK